MARKSIQIDVKFVVPKEEEGMRVLAEAMGEVHTKIIKDMLNQIECSTMEKNNIYNYILRNCLKSSCGKGKV